MEYEASIPYLPIRRPTMGFPNFTTESRSGGRVAIMMGDDALCEVPLSMGPEVCVAMKNVFHAGVNWVEPEVRPEPKPEPGPAPEPRGPFRKKSKKA